MYVSKAYFKDWKNNICIIYGLQIFKFVTIENKEFFLSAYIDLRREKYLVSNK